eukprot:EG_transcript_10170
MSAMQQALLEELQCPVCLDLLDDPVLLACAHSVCRECASQQIAAQQTFPSPGKRGLSAPSGTSMPCPVCKAATPIPNGVASLKRNHHLRNVVEQLQRHGQPAEPAVAVCGRCEACEAVSGCKSCGVLYCVSCRTEVHIGAFARHTFTDVDTFQRTTQRVMRVCDEHDEALKLYCPQCTLLVCTVCGIFGKHKTHGCKPLAEAGDCLPPLRELEGALHAAAAETARLQALLDKARASVEKDGRESLARCKRLFIAFLRSVEDNTMQRLRTVEAQQQSVGALGQRVAELQDRLPEAKAEFPAHLELHCLAVALAGELQRLEVTTPPLLQLDDAEKGKAKGRGRSPSTAAAITLPTLPAPSAGERHRCPPLAYGGGPPARLVPMPKCSPRCASRNRSVAVRELVDYGPSDNESDDEVQFL